MYEVEDTRNVTILTPGEIDQKTLLLHPNSFTANEVLLTNSFSGYMNLTYGRYMFPFPFLI